MYHKKQGFLLVIGIRQLVLDDKCIRVPRDRYMQIVDLYSWVRKQHLDDKCIRVRHFIVEDQDLDKNKIMFIPKHNSNS